MSNDLYDQEILPLYEYADMAVPEEVLLDTEHRFPSFLSAMREGNITLPKNILRDILSIYDPVRHDGMNIYHYVDVIRYVHKAIGMCGCYYGNGTDELLYMIIRRLHNRHIWIRFCDPDPAVTVHSSSHSYHRCDHTGILYLDLLDGCELILQFLHASKITDHVGTIQSSHLTERGEACYRILRYIYRQIQQEDLTLSKSTCDQ